MHQDRGHTATEATSRRTAEDCVLDLHAAAKAGRSVVDVLGKVIETSSRVTPNVIAVDAAVWAELITALDQAHAVYDVGYIPAYAS